MVDRRNPPPSVDIAPDRMATPMNPVQDLNCCKTSAGWQGPGHHLGADRHVHRQGSLDLATLPIQCWEPIPSRGELPPLSTGKRPSSGECFYRGFTVASKRPAIAGLSALFSGRANGI